MAVSDGTPQANNMVSDPEVSLESDCVFYLSPFCNLSSRCLLDMKPLISEKKYPCFFSLSSQFAWHANSRAFLKVICFCVFFFFSFFFFHSVA